MPVRVLLVTQWFDPEPTSKGLAFARELVRQGFSVEVLTGFPNYPGGILYPGYRMRLFQRETIDGVCISRVPLYPSHDKSVARRALNYISFALSSLFFGFAAAGRADVIYAYHPPLSVGVVVGILRAVCRRPVLYDIQDMWPDTLRASGMITSRMTLRFIAAICGWVYRHVDQIVVLSPGFKSLLEERGVPAHKVEVIYNWADEVTLTATNGELPVEFPGPDRFRIVFAGNMGMAQALDSVLEAASLLQSLGSHVSFVLVGGGVDVARLADLAASRNLANVTFIPTVPMAAVGSILRAADALLVHLRKDLLFEITIPSKTQAYMAVGKPILLAAQGDAADLVQRCGGGVLAQPEDAAAIAEAAVSLSQLPRDELEQMGRRAAEYYRENLSIIRGTARFGAIFARLAANTSAA